METNCAACGIEAECISVCGIFGAITYSCCLKCLASGREPYQNIVDYISSAGHWPQDINDCYQHEVRRQLKMHNKTEEEFRNDIEYSIAAEQQFFINYYNGKVEF